MTQKLLALMIVVWLIGRPCPAPAQESDAPVRIQGPAQLAGTSRYRPGEWGLISVRLVNTSNQDSTPRVVSFFEQYRMTQFSTQALVPARTIRTVSHPVYVPEDADEDVNQLDLLTMLIEPAATGEVVQRQLDGELFRSRLVPVSRTVPVTVLLARDGKQEQYAYEAIIAVRLDYNLDRRVGLLHQFPLPADLLAYAGTEQLVITDDSVARDVEGATAIRQWLVDGGHIWVFLELVEQDTLRQLLGNNCRVEYVDRITLPEVTIVDTMRSASLPYTREFDDPVPMVRVLADDVEVTHTVNGWPAAFQQRIGRGRVLFTALGARGWIRNRAPHDPQPKDPAKWSAYVPTQPLNHATKHFLRPSRSRPLSAEDLKPYLYDRIGHRIVGRRPVVTVLLLFCLGLLAIGFGLHRRGRLEQLLWFAPTASVVAVGVLGLMGMQARQGMRDTVAVVQLIDMDSEQDDLRVNGLAALYHLNKSNATLGGQAGGIVLPERFDREANVRRLVWTGRDQWHWQSLPLDAGLRFASFTFGPAIDQRAMVTGTFGPDGFLGTLEPGPFQNLSDMLIASPAQHTLALILQEGGRVSGGPTDVQGPGHYIADTLLTDEQRRRQEVLRQMLAATLEQEKYPYQTTLIAWADPLEAGFDFAEQADQIGSAVLAVPVQWERQQPGTQVTIPAPFLPYQAVATDDIGLTSAFDEHSGLWRSSAFATTGLLRFEIPDIVRPLEVEKVKLTLDISAPSRTVEVSIGQPEQLVPVAREDGPLGVLKFDIDDSQALRLDDSGRLHVLINVSQVTLDRGEDFQAAGQEVDWQIHSLQMEMTGRTLVPGPNN